MAELNDNVPESERWVPVADAAPHTMDIKTNPMPARARRDAEAMIAKHFPPR